MRVPKHPEAAFLATMTASATHEVRNVLAIIKESAGLIEDILQAKPLGGEAVTERILRSVHRIDVQVKRGADLLSNLNRLSHSLDVEVASVDLHDAIELGVFLSQRFARKKGLSIVGPKGETGARTTIHPLHLQMVIFSAIEMCIEDQTEGGSISVYLREVGGKPEVEVRGDGPGGSSPANSQSWDEFVALVGSVGATVEGTGEGFGIRISFHPAEVS